MCWKRRYNKGNDALRVKFCPINSTICEKWNPEGLSFPKDQQQSKLLPNAINSRRSHVPSLAGKRFSKFSLCGSVIESLGYMSKSVIESSSTVHQRLRPGLG